MKDWQKFVTTVTVAMATEWLSKHANLKNRKINDSRVRAYAKEMKRGRWFPTPLSAIGFGVDGTILNGHHRLHAIVMSDVACQLVVFRDVPIEALRVTDTELPRTNQQIGRMFGEDTSWDAALKVIAYLRSGSKIQYLGPSDLEILRAEFAPVVELCGESLSSIKVAGRVLRAGAVAGFLLALAGPKGSGPSTIQAHDFLYDVRLAANRESLGSKSTRNLIRWLENNSGAHARLALESAAAVVSALRQFANAEELDFVKPSAASLRPYIGEGA